MIKLPILAFHIAGCKCGDYVKLSIDEVFGHPNEIAYGGGYGAKGIIDIKY
ncbi:MAG: hypothetical protein FWC41_03895 [Firmicutes bacterium]|nr:hypothetical protein [Bacillota bacterium]